MRKDLIVKQSGFKDCAVSCLLSIIRYYGGNIGKEELSYIIHNNEKGTSAYHMIEGMKSIGFNGIGLNVKSEEIFKNNITCPFVAHVKNQKYYHFVVVYKININQKNLTIMDPAKGKIKIKFEEFNIIYLNSILEFYVINEIPKTDKQDKLKTMIIKELISNKKIVIILSLLGILTIIFALISNFYYKFILDDFIISKSILSLIKVTLLFMYLIVFKNFFMYLRNKTYIKFKNQLNNKITIEILRHIFNLPYRYFKQRPSGEMLSRIYDINDVSDLISNILFNIIVNIFLIFISLIIFVLINKNLSLLFILFILVYMLITYIYSKIIRKNVLYLKESYGNYNKNLTEMINNCESIKNIQVINIFFKKLEFSYLKFIRYLNLLESKIYKEQNIKDLIMDINNILIIFIGAILIINNKITLGNLFLFLNIIVVFIDPFKKTLEFITSYSYSINSYERIKDLITIREENINYSNKEMINGNIKFDGVSYSYDKVNLNLSKINFKINKGDKFLIYGQSGKGKSTLIKILLKYYEDYQGEIYIENKNIKDIKREIIYNSITYVSQLESLFNDTLKDNIILGRNINEKEYEKVLKICKVDSIRNAKKFRDNFLIEDGGFNISGGEKQRIILARSLLKNSNYIIFDECLSEVDVSLEKEIIKNIIKFYNNKTIIYITHKEEIKNMFEKRYEC